MSKLVAAVLMLGFSLIANVQASQLNESQAIESVGFEIRNLNICHQNEWRHLSVSLEYDSDNNDGINPYQVKEHVKDFLKSYEKPSDFWEIMNTNLINSILLAFPEIHSLKSKLTLAPDKTLSFQRQSTVKYERNAEAFKESFNFTKTNYMICNQTFESLDLHVAFDINENPKMFDYPDYQWIDQAMEEFFKETPISFSSWSSIKPLLENFLLERFQTLTAITVDITLAK